MFKRIPQKDVKNIFETKEFHYSLDLKRNSDQVKYGIEIAINIVLRLWNSISDHINNLSSLK